MKTSLLVVVLLSLAFAPNAFRLGHRHRGGGEPVAVLITTVTLVAIAFMLAGSPSLTSSSDAVEADDHGMGSPMEDACEVSAIGVDP
jgi:hypothetical protein